MTEADPEAPTDQQKENVAREMMRECFRVLAAVNREFDGWTEMDATSRLAEDNAATALFRPMSHDIHYLISSALDHLNLVRDIWASGRMPPFAPFTLIRSAIEACAYGLWLQEGAVINTRVLRLLELQWDQRRNVNTFTDSLGAHTAEITDWIEAVLNDTKNRRSGLKQCEIGSLPSVTDLLKYTDRTVPHKTQIDGLGAWRICSGVAHGNRQVATGLMSQRSFALWNGEEGTEHSVSTLRLATVFVPAMDYLSRLMKLVLANIEPRPGRPAFVDIQGGPLPPTMRE